MEQQKVLMIDECLLASEKALTSARDNGNAWKAIEELRNEIVGGLLYTHSRANSNTNRILEAGSFLYALIELLKEKEIVTIEELDERKVKVAKRLGKRFLRKGMGVVIQEPERDKYTFREEVHIDCENRVHLCKAACCRMSFPLSMQDIQEGIIRWDLRSPYLISQNAEGYCKHLERATCQCTVREHRPIPCQAYDCRNDQRIWLDFEKKAVNPNIDAMFQRNRLDET
jgi:hypothetical protein